MKKLDVVSIIIPSYNHAKYIEECIDSCIKQNYQGKIEVIVVDDCSTDETPQVMKSYDDICLSNRTVSFFAKAKNKGINDSISYGLKKSTGRYVQILASDDKLVHSKISMQVAFLNESNLDGVYARAYSLFEDEVQEVYLESFKRSYSDGKGFEFVCSQDYSSPLLQSGLFLKSIFMDNLIFRSDFKSDDWVFLIILFEKYNVGYLDVPLVYYRQHDANTFKNYFVTLPMRVDIVSRLVPTDFKSKAFSNIFLSQAGYLFRDRLFTLGLKFFLASFVFNPSSSHLYFILRFLLPRKLQVYMKRFRQR